jgi:hypothetical protein
MLKEQLRVVYGLQKAIPKDENGIPIDNKSEVEMVVSDAIQNRRVDFELRGLAGHEAAIEQLPDGTTYMIERSGRWVEPVKGDWSPIERLINGLFREGQAEYILGNCASGCATITITIIRHDRPWCWQDQKSAARTCFRR